MSKLIDYIDGRIPAGLERPFFIVTSDHGETLGEMQETKGFAFDHGKILTYSQMHVPLLFLWKGVIPEGKRLDDIVGLVDIAPTITGFVDEGRRFSSDGISLKELVAGNGNARLERTCIVAQRRLIEEETSPQFEYLHAGEYCIIEDNWCLRTNEARGDELYDILTDPLEHNDLSKDEGDIVRELLAKLEEWKNKFPEAKGGESPVSDENAALLRSLGYLQ